MFPTPRKEPPRNGSNGHSGWWTSFRRNGTPAQVRSRAEFARFFSGLDLIEPGIERVTNWRPDATEYKQGELLPWYAGVARK
ncbi:SAM-dependent methyltransferase [Streptomyces bobili]|uniref:SAM-dependent methyltransferase n=1 Tax=Streptomyces bobili TaxID=67280 RepID=UPI0033AD753C